MLENIKRVKEGFLTTDLFHINKSRRRLREIEDLLVRIQHETPTREMIVKQNKATKEMEDILEMEELYWRQISRASWLKGDKNTNFFHKKASQRSRRNYISRVKNQEGQWVQDVIEIGTWQRSSFQTFSQQAELQMLRMCVLTLEENWSHTKRP